MKPPLRRWTRPGEPLLTILSHRQRNFSRPDARHQEHEINLGLSGAAVYRFGDGASVGLAAGEILLMPAGTIHAISVEDHFRMSAIHIHPSAFASVSAGDTSHRRMLAALRTWKSPPPWRRVIEPDAYAMLERLSEESVLEQNRRAPARRTMLAGLATQAAVLFLRLMFADTPDEVPDLTARRILTLRSWIDRHFSERCALEQLARMAHLAPTYFAARFRDIVGTPPMTYVRDRRMEHARLLLERTHHPVKVVAYSVGYSDISHFNRVFKQAVGRTPTEFRSAS